MRNKIEKLMLRYGQYIVHVLVLGASLEKKNKTMTVKERLLEFIKYKNLKSRAFCRSIGVSETYVSSMRSSIQPDKLSIIASVYPDLNTGWLMSGDGEMIKKNEIIDLKENFDHANLDLFKDKLIELFTKGEIYSATVVSELNLTIQNLNKEIATLEYEKLALQNENQRIKKLLKESEPINY